MFKLIILIFALIHVRSQYTSLDCGFHGPAGPPGRDGRDGRDGLSVYGPKGDTGPKGSIGPPGAIGECSCVRPNIKQCTWKSLSDGRDSGHIVDCAFIKNDGNSSLHVTWHGDLRSYTTVDAPSCNRWFFTFNGVECKEPASIDAIIVSTQKDSNEHRPTTITGLCSELPPGNINIGLDIGACEVMELGDAHTGWITSSRIIVEEVHLQS